MDSGVCARRRSRFDLLRIQGCAFQVALLHAAVVERAVVKEIPVNFINRQFGKSKLGLSDILEFIVNVWWIRFQESKTFLKFGLVGASGVLVNIGSFMLCLSTGMNKYIASPIAIELSILSNFLFNNYWTFRRRRTKDRVRIKGLKYNLVSILSVGSLLTYYSSVKKEQWRDVAALIDSEAAENDLVLFNSGLCRGRIFNYYSKGQGFQKKAFPEKTRVVNSENIKKLSGLIDGRERVWLVLSHSGKKSYLINEELGKKYFLKRKNNYKGIKLFLYEKK